MLTIPEVVGRIIRKSPFLEEGLALGILNHSALGRLIKPEVEREAMKKVQDGAIVVALSRLSRVIEKKTKKPKSVFQKTPDLIVRMNLFEVTYANSESLIRKQKKLMEQMSARQHLLLTFTRGLNETTIIASSDLRNRILAGFKGEKMISQIARLASVSVLLPKGTAQIPGVYSYILRALAWEAINVVEVVSTLNEFTIILEDKNIDSAFSIIKYLF
jgi:hypothetical protein